MKEICVDFENHTIGQQMTLFAVAYAYARKHNARLTYARSNIMSCDTEFVRILFPEIQKCNADVIRPWHVMFTSPGYLKNVPFPDMIISKETFVDSAEVFNDDSSDYVIISGEYTFVNAYELFKEYAGELREILRAPNTLDKTIAPQYANKVGIGANTLIDNTEQFDISYYEQCMREFPEGTEFVLFADDENVNKQLELTGLPIYVLNDFTSADFLIISQFCKKGFICGQTEFSWWLAFLSEARRVICDNPANKLLPANFENKKMESI